MSVAVATNVRQAQDLIDIQAVDHFGLGMRSVTVRVRGLTPILMANPAPMLDPKPKPPRGTRGSKKDLVPELTPDQVAEQAAYRGEDSALCFPSIALRSSIMQAGVGYKAPGTSRPLYEYMAELSVLPEGFMYFQRNGQRIHEFIRHSCRAVNEHTGGAIPTHRAMVDLPWEFVVQLAWYETPEPDSDYDQAFVRLVLQTANRAGVQVGIGCFRPAKKGYFGRYRLEVL